MYMKGQRGRIRAESDIKYIRIFSRDSRVLRSTGILDLALMSFPIPPAPSILALPKTYSSIVAIEYQCKRYRGFFTSAFRRPFLPPIGRHFRSFPQLHAPKGTSALLGIKKLRYLFRAFSGP